MPGNYRYKRRGYRPRRRKISKVKKLVTGQTQPTMLEKIASGIGSAARVASAVLPIVQAINTEEKYFDTYFIPAPVLAAPDFQCLTKINNGTDDINRIGNSLLAKQIAIKVRMLYNGTSTVGSNRLRLIVLVDKMADANVAAAPTTAQLFENFAIAGMLSGFNKDFTDRFTILIDRFITLTPNSGMNTDKTIKLFKKLNFHIRYVGTGGSAIGPNNIFFVTLTGDTPLANVPVIQAYSRINFTDN